MTASEAVSGRRTVRALSIPRAGLLVVLLGIAMASSSVVFSEPAPVDVLMLGFIGGLVVLGGWRLGTITLFNGAAWLVLVALGLVGTLLSPDFGGAFKHQVVTLYLAIGAMAIAAFVAAEPVRRGTLVLACYTFGALVACAAAYVGYFEMAPGAYDLFTRYGRARGTFKDPNVFGAAVAPAICYLVWLVLRRPLPQVWLPAALAMFMLPALIISFSRGAWISLAASLLVVGVIALTRTRRSADRLRLWLFGAAGVAGLVVLVMAVMQLPEVRDLMLKRASLTQGYDEGPEGRFGGQAKGIGLAIDNPFGIGTFTFREVHHHEEVHNVYITQFHNAGWIGGFAYIASVLLTLAAGIKGAMRPGPLQGFFVVSTAAFVGLVVEGLVIDSDHWRHFFIFMGLVWGFADARQVSADRSSRRHDDRPGLSFRGR